MPGTIGPIAWLSRNQDKVRRIKHGLVLACVGDRGSINYKRSRRGSAEIDRAVECVMRGRSEPFEVRDFSPYGYDERQYCSPGLRPPVGSFRRTPYGEYAEYHTSADNLDFVSEAHLADSLGALLETIDLLESDVAFRNLSPNCEPQLGRRGLLPAASEGAQMALLWMLESVRRRQQPSQYCRALAASSGELRRARKSWSRPRVLENARSGVNRTQ